MGLDSVIPCISDSNLTGSGLPKVYTLVSESSADDKCLLVGLVPSLGFAVSGFRRSCASWVPV